MSMSTIYVLIGANDSGVIEVKAVAEALDPTPALAQLSWWKGDVYACRLSDDAAAQVRAAVMAPAGSVTRGVKPTSALSMLKMYSQSMVKVADSTGA